MEQAGETSKAPPGRVWPPKLLQPAAEAGREARRPRPLSPGQRHFGQQVALYRRRGRLREAGGGQRVPPRPALKGMGRGCVRKLPPGQGKGPPHPRPPPRPRPALPRRRRSSSDPAHSPGAGGEGQYLLTAPPRCPRPAPGGGGAAPAPAGPGGGAAPPDSCGGHRRRLRPRPNGRGEGGLRREEGAARPCAPPPPFSSSSFPARATAVTGPGQGVQHGLS